uniref:Spermatogenesis-defective protein 39 homolog n=1 Tax=Ciona intestinalis TaxID=7719 RepID=H2XWR7_CIOIN|nr:spermatogenesis-defective protein 39 homolog [Ciona intestinalis]|eukprot:XP_002128413.1 spermatogenesis-defective protein 39 homolog [Ciona intestinalis]
MASARKKTTATVSDEVYWNSSVLSPFNFNDDEENEDSIDVITWDGTNTSVSSKSQPNIKSQPTASVHGTQATAPVHGTHVTSARYTPRKAYNSTTTKLDQPRPTPDTRSITDVVNDKKNSPTTTDIVKLESEVATLRRQLTQAKRDRAVAPSKSDTLRRIMVGEACLLELYKSKEDKCSLLDAAIERFDGNAIVAATLFMRDTLKRDLFSKELMRRGAAVDHYCAYLRAAGEVDELHETLSAIGLTEEAAVLKYRQCLTNTSSTTPEIRASGLKDCIKYYFDSDIRLANETSAIQEQISLMRRQSVVDDGDKASQASGQVPVFKSHPRKECITHKSVVTTLYYFCYYHWGEAEGLLSSPTSLRNEHKIAEKQFVFTAIAALCKMRRWRDLENLLTTPRTLFRNSRLHANIGFDKVVDVLSKNLAPPDALAKYCAEVESVDKRLELSVRLKCHKVAIDTIIHLRDRQQLMSYLDQIPQSNQHMRQYLTNNVRSQEIKWRN